MPDKGKGYSCKGSNSVKHIFPPLSIDVDCKRKELAPWEDFFPFGGSRPRPLFGRR